MNGKELFLGLSYISPKYIDEAKNYGARQNDGKQIRFRKTLLIAAVIALTLLLVGCAVAAYARKIMPDWGGVGVYDSFTHIDIREQKADWQG